MKKMALFFILFVLSFSSTAFSETTKDDFIGELRHSSRNICTNTISFSDFNLKAPLQERPLSEAELNFLEERNIIRTFYYATHAWEIATDKFFKFQKLNAGVNCTNLVKLFFPLNSVQFSFITSRGIVKESNWGTSIFLNKNIVWMVIHPDVLKNKKFLVSTLAHEFGHVIGLEHAPDQERDDAFDVMRPDGHYDRQFVYNHTMCLNGCLRIGKSSLAQLYDLYGVMGKEVSLW